MANITFIKNKAHFICCLQLVVLFIMLLPFAGLCQLPFHRGVNLTEWFQAGSARDIQFSKFTRKDFEDIKSLGCDVIRLPLNLHAMTDGKPDYKLNDTFLGYLDQAVNWAEELHLYLILDNHSFDPVANTDPAIGQLLIPVWRQMAYHFKARSSFLYYEILNEPHGIDDALWGKIQQDAINAIRQEDTNHFIVVGGTNWNNYKALNAIPVYTDTKLVYTFHFYDPFLFTHQGATWVSPSLQTISGVPFPNRPGAARPDMMQPSFKGTWVEKSIVNYPADATPEKVKKLIDVAVEFAKARKVSIFCGELGVFMRNSDNTDRVAWYKLVVDYLNQKNIPWTMWDYKGSFGLFNKESGEVFDKDLNLALVKALTFNHTQAK